jgi:hypothetical protein
MYIPIVGALACSALIISGAEYARRFCMEKAVLVNTPNLPEATHQTYMRKLNILHPVSMFLWFVSLSPLLLISSLRSIGRKYFVTELGIGVIVAVAFWLGKHFEWTWAQSWFTDPLTTMRCIILATAGMVTICCLYFLLSDPLTAKREIVKAFNRSESSKGEHHAH